MHTQTFNLILQSSRLIAPGVKHFSCIREDNNSLDFIPGQFITLHLSQGERTLRRSYSIASIPKQEHTIDFAASYIAGGIASEFLFQLEPGQTLATTGPFGRLILRDEPAKRLVLVATGTGVTPYRAMLAELEQRLEQGTEVVVMQGVQRAENLLYKDDFLARVSQYSDKFQFQAFYSREQPTSLQSFEYSGHVQSGFAQLSLNPQQDIIYLCGNPNMVDEAFNGLREHGFDTAQIRREKYISSK